MVTKVLTVVEAYGIEILRRDRDVAQVQRKTDREPYWVDASALEVEADPDPELGEDGDYNRWMCDFTVVHE